MALCQFRSSQVDEHQHRPGTMVWSNQMGEHQHVPGTTVWSSQMDEHQHVPGPTVWVFLFKNFYTYSPF